MKPPLLILIWLLSLHAAIAQTTAREWANKGYASSDPTEQIRCYSEAIKLDPKYAIAYNNRGNAKNKLGRYQEAITDLDQAIKLDPKYARAYNNRGNAKDDLGRYQEAITDYDQAILLDPKYANAYYNRGYVKNELNRYQEAVTDYDQAILLNPKDADTYYNRGLAKNNAGRYQEAITDYDQAIQIDPRFAMAYNNRGTSKNHLGRYQEAVNDYDQAILLDPRNARAHLNKGRALVKLGRYEQALDFFRQGEALDNSLNYHEADKKVAQQSVSKRPVPVTPTTHGKRYALIIGNSAYQHGSTLAGRPINDATDMASRLQQLGFSVTVKSDADKKTIERSLREFNVQIKGAEVALFFYSGHGVEVNGQNYLLPVDAELGEPDDADTEAINVQTFLDKLKNSGAAFSVAVLDACRNNPFKNWPGAVHGEGDRGFKTISNIAGLGNMYLAMATGWNNVAQNGTGRNGIYTEALLRYLKSGEQLETVFQLASVLVKQRTKNAQNPQLLTEYATEKKMTF